MSEHLKYLGRRQELELEKKKLELRMDGLICNIRDAADPLETKEELRTDAILEWAVELATNRDRYLGILSDLKKIRDVLGR